MRDKRRALRRQQIEEAAYALLAERGFGGASMLEVAKRAKASNQTLYEWYGDKIGLFAAMIERNRAGAVEVLTACMAAGPDLAADLERFGTALLQGILSDRAVLLNRAAAADVSGELGCALTQYGRASVVPLLAERLAVLPVPTGFDDHRDMADCLIALLVGDQQNQRLLGAMPPPNEAICRAQAVIAVGRFIKLVGLELEKAP